MYQHPSRIGRYEIKTLIGAGGMGSLYLARDTNPNTNRLVALKLLLASLDSGDLRERFAREARALAALNHPNIVDIYDSGEFQGSPFIVMEYVRGETLGEQIKRRAPMTVGQKLRLMIDLCSGLGHAHEAGIIHRDIKPANLMVDQRGRVKILDFGIARVSENLTRAGLAVTQLNMRIGTPGYMSPEQIEGGEIDRRSDLFAVGAVCYELLAYREAFAGANTRQIENKVLQAEPERLTSLIPDLDPQIEQIVTRALAKDPNQRFQDAMALEEAFERQLWRLGPSSTPAPLPPRQTPHPAHHAPHASKLRDSRADVAYQRSLALYAEGAQDAARRCAIEALAENPDHEEARTFVEQFGPNMWPPPPPRTFSAGSSSDPTVLRTESHAVGTMTADAETVLSTGDPGSAERRRTRSAWQRHGKALKVAALVFAVVAIAGSAVLLGLWFWRPGPMLTIKKPEGGTISGRGINCGTGGDTCAGQFDRGEPADLRAEPDKGFLFGKFTGDCAPHGMTIMSGPRTCGATFERIPEVPVAPGVLLTIVPPEGGTIIGDGITCGTLGKECSTEHPEGKVVALKPLAEPEYTFKGFTGDCGRAGETKMSQPRRCGALFVRDRAAISAVAANRGENPAGTSSRPAPSRGEIKPSSTTPDPLDGHTANPGVTTPVEPPPDNPGSIDPPKPPPPPPSPLSIAKDDIQKLLNAYREAYEAMDVNAIKRLYPKAPVSNLSYVFKQYKSLEYTYAGPPDFIDVNPELGTATVKVAALLKPEYNGPKSPPQKLINQFSLKRFEDTWKIEELKYPAK